MKKILVTGAKGFIGKNLIVSLKQTKIYEIIEIYRESSQKELVSSVLNADFIVHLAGVNRPKEKEEFYKGNSGLTQSIVSILESNNKSTPILITSSIHSELDNDYGISKKQSEETLKKYSEKMGSDVYIFRLPNVFGKWCKPNYNSAVATFCNNIANDLDIWVNDPSIELDLVYIDDVVGSIIECIDNHNLKTKNFTKVSKIDNYFYKVNNVYRRSLGNIIDSIKIFKCIRENLVIPDFSDDFNKYLYATYLTYLNENNFSYKLDKKEDNRGWLSELIKSEKFGQLFISKTKKGITRGNHWHHSKTEKFIVVQGKALIRLRKIGCDDILEYFVSGDYPEVIDIPPGYTHSIESVGDIELITIFWSNEIFDKDKPDTYFLEVK